MKAYLKKKVWDLRNIILHRIGHMTHTLRQSPDFLIIGAQKGGTSSLFYYLKFHPQIKRPIKKEIHYFNIFYHKGLRWYLAYFPKKSDKYITGEASPGYIYHPKAPERVHKHNPDIKLILLLRNPILRAYSAYQMNRRMGLDERETFEEAISFELEKREHSVSVYNYDRHNFFYLQRGEYVEQINRWLAYFSKDQLLILESDAFFNDTKSELSKVFDFLNIQQIFPESFKPMNVGKYPPLSEAMYAKLEDHFRQDIEVLRHSFQIDLTLSDPNRET